MAKLREWDRAPWSGLKVGDRVRVVRMPPGCDEPGYVLHPDTRRLYMRLIARGRSLRVAKIDEFGVPWVHSRFRRKDGRTDYHSLSLNDETRVKVRSRRKK